LNARKVRYLIVGGYAVGYHGYVRATADLDVWVARDEANSDRLVKALSDFGFEEPSLDANTFQKPNQILRMGIPPVQIEVMTSILGVEFDECYALREETTWDRVRVHVISLAHLLTAKRTSGRMQDLVDLSYLEDSD